jgi:hypothetical protein
MEKPQFRLDDIRDEVVASQTGVPIIYTAIKMPYAGKPADERTFNGPCESDCCITDDSCRGNCECESDCKCETDPPSESCNCDADCRTD